MIEHLNGCRLFGFRNENMKDALEVLNWRKPEAKRKNKTTSKLLAFVRRDKHLQEFSIAVKEQSKWQQSSRKTDIKEHLFYTAY